MKNLFLSAAAAVLLLGAAEAKATELPAYEVFGFPITPLQMSVLGSANVQERPPTPALTLGGMPASPLQVLVLTPRPKVSGEAAAAKPIEANFSQR